MAQVPIAGKSLIVKIGGVTCARSRDVSLTVDVDEIDVSARDGSGVSGTAAAWASKLPGFRSWTLKAGHLWVLDEASIVALVTAMMTNASVAISFKDAAGGGWTGTAYVKNFNANGPYKGEAALDVTFFGTGALVKSQPT